MIKKFVFLVLIFGIPLNGILNQVFNFPSYLYATLPVFFIMLLFSISFMKKISLTYVIFSLIIAIVSSFSILHSILLFNPSDLLKPLLSLFYLLLLMFIAPSIVHVAKTLSDKYIKTTISLSFYLLIFLGYVSYITGFSIKLQYNISKSMIIFSEPSHFALAIIPMAVFMSRIYQLYFKKIFIAILLIVLSILVENLTLFLGGISNLILIFAYANKREKVANLIFNKATGIILVSIVFIFVLNIPKAEYFLERILCGLSLTEEQVHKVSEAIHEVLK